MKIGILTFHRAINYGAVLQCFALYEALHRMGHDVEVIDYRPPYIEKYRCLLYGPDFKKQGFLSKVKSLCLLPVSYQQKRKVSKAFDAFLDEHLRFSSIVRDRQDIPSYYDVIVFGSDQIWNPLICDGLDAIFYGQFAKGRTRFVTYAASLGTPQQIAKEYWAVMSDYLQAFDFISVRESKLADCLHDMGRPAEVVFDPTLIAPEGLFEQLAVKPQEEKYVLLYMLEYNQQAIAFAQDIARQRGCQLLRLQAMSVTKKSGQGYKSVIPKGVNEFLGFFKYADYVVNVSFHGTAFSVIFKKDFYTLKSKNYERAYDFLQSVSLQERFVDPMDKVDMSPIDYVASNQRLSQLRAASISYLANSLMSS